MSAEKLEIKVVLSAIEHLVSPLRAIKKASGETSRAIESTRTRIAALQQVAGQIEEFKRLEKAVGESGKALQEQQQKAAQAARALKEATEPTKKLTTAFEKENKAAEKLNEKHVALTTSLKQQSDVLDVAGISTQHLADRQIKLGIGTREATAELEKQRAKLAQINEQTRRLHAAQAEMGKARGKMGSGAITAGMGVAGFAAVNHLMQPAQEYQTDIHRIRALGMGEDTVKAADRWARSSKMAGVSMKDNIEIYRDGLTIFADRHHAEMAAPVMQKMKFANAALYGQEKGDERSRQLYDMLKVVELRRATHNAAEFKAEADKIQRVMSSTGGRVGAEDYRQLIARGGVAAKRMNTDVFYNLMEPLVQEMGGNQVGFGIMSAYQNLYNGKTTTSAARRMQELGLLNADKVEYDKIGQLKRIKTGGIVNAEQYAQNPFEWIDKTFIPALAKKGITKTDDIVKELSSIVTNRQGANLLSTYVMQRGIINRSADRNRHAQGVDDLYSNAQASVAGQKLKLGANWDNLKQTLTSPLLQPLAELLEKINAITTSISAWAQAHPTLVRWLGLAAVSVMAILTVIGALTMAFGAILLPMAAMKFALAMLGTSIPGVVAGGFNLLIRAFGGISTVLIRLATLAMGHPLIALIAVIAMGAIYIWQNWDTLGPKFAALWEKFRSGCETAWAVISTAFAAGWGQIRQWGNSAIAWFEGLPGRLASIGAQMIDGLISGIGKNLARLKATIIGVASSAAAWFRQKLDIHSPSRVFHQFGVFTMQGFEHGILSGKEGPIKAIDSFARAIISQPIARIDTRPPIMSMGARHAESTPASHQAHAEASSLMGAITIHIHAAPGMNERDIADLVARRLDHERRSAAARRRSAYQDYD
jgi:hypothetical protein